MIIRSGQVRGGESGKKRTFLVLQFYSPQSILIVEKEQEKEEEKEKEKRVINREKPN